MAYNGKPYSLELCYSPDHEHNIWGKQSSYVSVVVLHQDGILYGGAGPVGMFPPAHHPAPAWTISPAMKHRYSAGSVADTILPWWFGRGWQLYGFEIRAIVFTSVQVPQHFASCPAILCPGM